MAEDELTQSRKAIFTIFVTKATNMMSLDMNPEVCAVYGEPIPDEGFDTKYDVMKFVYLNILKRKKNIRFVETLSKTQNKFKLNHILQEKLTLLLLEFFDESFFETIDVRLMTKNRSSTIKTATSRIPDVEDFISNPTDRVIFITDAVRAVNDVFVRILLEKLDRGESVLTASQANSHSSTGSNTPDCIYLG